jgi:hypothetical protein
MRPIGFIAQALVAIFFIIAVVADVSVRLALTLNG